MKVTEIPNNVLLACLEEARRRGLVKETAGVVKPELSVEEMARVLHSTAEGRSAFARLTQSQRAMESYDRKVTPQMREQICADADKHMTRESIAKKHRVSLRTVYGVLRVRDLSKRTGISETRVRQLKKFI